MAKLLLASYLLISLFSSAQGDSTSKTNLATNQDTSQYISRGLEFIKQIEHQSLTNKNFILADEPFSFKYYDCLDDILADTTIYTKEEIAFIKRKTFISLSKWTPNIFPEISIISRDTINAIFNDPSKWWTYFYEHYGRSFRTFSFPIFFRDNTFCLFYSDYHCGGHCGRGTLKLYKKENGEWVEIKSYCNWISQKPYSQQEHLCHRGRPNASFSFTNSIGLQLLGDEYQLSYRA